MTTKTPLTIIALCILGIIITVMMSSCSTSRVPNVHTPSKREIRKAMRYSTSEYALPQVPLPPHSRSPYADMQVETIDR
jgi:hypothetical protein